MPVDPNTPVLVGVGAVSLDDEPVALMAAAVREAVADAGIDAVRTAIDTVIVPQGTWRYPDPGRLVAGRLGVPGARTHFGELGVSQQTLVNEALLAVSTGRSAVAVVVGADARAWARHPDARETEQPAGTAPDEVHRRDADLLDPAELSAGVVVPVQQYAMIDNALRHAEGRTPVEQRADIAELWARYNAVAATNPVAAFPAPRSAEWLATAGPDNRPLAFPYNKWHASQWTVDQGAALIFCTAGTARRLGVAEDRWVYPLVAIDADYSVSLSRRRHLHRWPAMAALGRAAEARLGRSVASVDLLEVYSCFPSAVRVQQRELGLPADRTPTVTGGMPFAGGPFNNFVYQATAAMVPELRRHPGTIGAVTTVCGLLTKPGLAVWSTEPDGRPPLVADLARQAADDTPTVDVVDGHRGPATVASYTVTYDGADPARTVVLADLPDGRRCVTASDDRDVAAHATTDELIGTAIAVDGPTFTLAARTTGP